ncbi:MAG: right-handed parallel beta-helix repeat-containing protein [Prevotella sp.]|nr:right-handed parallel beta-helix repeat-containing protein [Prevotella sp.]MBR1463034.1 right-handed parallel beta-helix repeat-containing protein [Prevotella sp.]
MKKNSITYLLFTALMSLASLHANAQTTWDFGKSLSDADAKALNEDTNWAYDSEKARYTYNADVSGSLKAGSHELDLTKGLQFSAGSGKIKIDAAKRVQLGGKSITVTIPSLKKGQTVTVNYSSSNKTTGQHFDCSNLTTSDFGDLADGNQKDNVGTVTTDGSVVLTTSGSINVYSISVSEAAQGGDQPGNADVSANAVAFNPSQNQARLMLKDGSAKYYNTNSLNSIDIDGTTVTVSPSSANAEDKYYGSVTGISFSKKVDSGEEGQYSNASGKVSITESKGWLESAYVKWNLFEGAESYNVYVKGGNYGSYTKIDQQLVRNYGSYGRADIVGLKAASGYAIKVVPVISGNESESNANEVTSINVKNYNREGFAHFNYSKGVGAYNDDGTLKSGTRVLYVTKNTAKTVKASVTTSSKGGVTDCTGLQAIIDAYQKGYDTTPLAVRIIGMVKADDMDSFSSSEEGLQVKGKSADSEMNITIEGIGDDATVYGFGFLVRNCKGVEFRNFAILQCMDDGISMDTDNSNIWVHHLDVFYGKKGSGDKEKGDGAIDVKSDSKYVTIDNCHFWDTGKSSMCGMKDESGENWITYHNNWFDHSDSRHARVRTMSVHIYNNYFDNVAKYGVGATSGSSLFVENNYFLNTKKPILSSQQGTDALGSGTFSGENGGMIKAYGNYFDRSAKNFKYYTQNNPASTGYDAYETATRNDKVPASEVTRVGGTAYNNFDTNASKMYSYTAIAAESVPAQVMGFYGAGRMNHGDLQFTFTDNTGSDDGDSQIITALESLVKNYTSPLVGFFGEENGQGGEQGGGSGDNGGQGQGGGSGEQGGQGTSVEGTVLCTFNKSGTPSSNLFTISGNGSDSKGTVSIDGTSYSTCLKIETATSIKFNLSQTMKMTLYFGPSETASIKINGTKITGSGNTYTQTLQAGDYELTKDKSVNLFGIKLEPVE